MTPMLRSFTLAGLLAALAFGRANSQRLPADFPSLRYDVAPSALVAQQVAPEPRLHSPVLAAAGLGILGWGIGAVGTVLVTPPCDTQHCVFEAIFYGGAAGGGLGLAAGAHLGNRRRGKVLLDLATSGAVWGVAYLVMRSFSEAENYGAMVATAIILPPVQLAATVAVERATGRARARAAGVP